VANLKTRRRILCTQEPEAKVSTHHAVEGLLAFRVIINLTSFQILMKFGRCSQVPETVKVMNAFALLSVTDPMAASEMLWMEVQNCPFINPRSSRKRVNHVNTAKMRNLQF
jgi:hypothetical protein